MFKVYFLSLTFFVLTASLYAQVRIVNVDPVNDVVTIKNFGGSTENITSHRLCARFAYTGLSAMNLDAGSLENLGPGESVTVSGWSMTDVSSDLGLYLPTGSFGVAANMLDFTQWGGGGIGREGVAVTAGLWTAGDFITGDPPYSYTGDGNQNGLSFWQATTSVSSETDIISYSFPEETGGANINAGDHAISVEVDFGTDLSNLIATFTLSPGATAEILSTAQESGVTTNDFTSPVTYTITAEDGTTEQNWAITVLEAPNDEAEILTYSFPEQTGAATIGTTTIDIEVVEGTDVSELIATFTLSEGASVAIIAISQESGITPNDFTNSVTYTITAQDGINEKQWTVVVTIQDLPSTETDINSYSFNEQTGPANINATIHRVDIEVENGSDVGDLVALFSLSEGAVATITGIEQESGVTSNDFSNLVTYTITAEDGSTAQDWIIAVSVALNDETDIISFSISDQLTEPIINNTNHTVSIEVRSDIDVSNQIATFGLSQGANASVSTDPQESGVTINDFTNPVDYLVTAEDGTTTQVWTVTISVKILEETDIVSFSFAEQVNPAVIDPDNHTIEIEVIPGTDLSNLVATFSLSFGATAKIEAIDQASGVTANDFTNPITYQVTAEDAITTQDWVITVTLDPQTDIVTFSFPEQTGPAVVDPGDHTVMIEVERETDLSALIATFTLSNGAMADISSVLQVSGVTTNDFSSPVTYTITSQGSAAVQDWLVTVSSEVLNDTDFITFSLPQQTAPSSIDLVNHSIDVAVEFGTDLVSLIPAFTLSGGATATLNGIAQESGITINDFTNPVTYIVVAEDEVTTQEWLVEVSVDENLATEIISFSIPGQIASFIDPVDHKVNVDVDFGTDVTSLEGVFTISEGATITVDGIVQQSGVSIIDFTDPVTYEVTAQDGVTTQNWLVTVDVALNTETDILSYSIPEESGDAIIDNSQHTVELSVRFGTELSGLIAIFELSPGATAQVNSIPQMGGLTENNFEMPVLYQVIAEDQVTIQDWVVTVTVAANTETDIISFSFEQETEPAVINAESHFIDVEVPFGTDLSNLVATFALSEGAAAGIGGISQESGTTTNDFSNAVIYTITAEDGLITQDWSVCTIVAANIETDILSFSFAEKTESAIIDAANHLIEVEVASESDIENLVATFVLSEGAEAEINGVVQVSGVSSNNFSSAVEYNVIAQDGITATVWGIMVAVQEVTAAEKLKTNELIIFPNPVSTQLGIKIANGYYGSVILVIRDNSGKEVLTRQYQKSGEFMESTIDISGLKSQLLHIEVISDNQKITGRVIKH